MQVRHLIEGCCDNDSNAWATLWEVVSSAALFPIRRLLQRQSLDMEFADDVMQEFYLYIREDNLHHLRSFRGHSMAQFRAFIRTLAVHFALNTLRKIQRLRRKEDEAARAVSRPDRGGPTAHQIQTAMQELTSLMSAADRAKVLQLLDKNVPADVSSESNDARKSKRTERRWREELYRKYARRFT
jgi:DNA-directed RNA polymerase specialized sigma24 family protein